MQDTDARDFAQFMERRAEAAQAYVRGDATALSRLVALTGDASFFAPRGGAVHGAEDVASTYTQDVQAFAPGGESRFEILHMGASDGLAYWVGFQRARVYMRGHADVVPFNLRVTELFRRDGADWTLIHRHADTLIAEETKP